MSRTVSANGKTNYSMSLNSTWSRESLALVTRAYYVVGIKSIQCLFINRHDIMQANNSGRTYVKTGVSKCFVQQVYQKITIRQLSRMLRQLQWVRSLSEVVSLWLVTWRITVAAEHAVRGSTREEPCWIAHRPCCRTGHRTSVHPECSIQGVRRGPSLSRCASVQRPWWNHSMRWRRTWDKRWWLLGRRAAEPQCLAVGPWQRNTRRA